MIKAINLLILTMVFTASVFAQANQSGNSNKIAVIDTSLFNNQKQGIKKLIQAERSYSIENFEGYDLKKEINELETKIIYLLSKNESINESYTELQKLKAELKDNQEHTKAEYHRKYSIVVEPVIEKIRRKIIEFSKINFPRGRAARY